MADKTFGVKVSEELHEKVREMIESSGISAKEWFEKAVAVTEMNNIKQGATDYSQDLSELEVHTTRIYELISNMIQRSIYIKDHAVKEVADKLEQREAIIGEYQEKTKAAIEETKQYKELVESAEKEKQDLSKQLDELRSTHSNNQLLIDEYKEKNDTLNGLVAKYLAFAEENEQLKKEFAEETQQLKADFSREKRQLELQVNEVSTQADEQTDEIKDLKRDIEVLKTTHVNELERLTDKKEYEKDKAVLEVERSFQDKLIKANEDHNEKIKSLYDEIAAMRKEYEIKIDKLQKSTGTEQNPS